MKILAAILTIVPLLATANPVADAGPEAERIHERENFSLEKRAKTCQLTGCDVRYHTKPDASSPAPGQISGCNKKVSLSCYTSGKPVNGYKYWDKIASGAGKGYYITEYYIDKNCAVPSLPPC